MSMLARFTARAVEINVKRSLGKSRPRPFFPSAAKREEPRLSSGPLLRKFLAARKRAGQP